MHNKFYKNIKTVQFNKVTTAPIKCSSSHLFLSLFCT